MKIYDRGSMIVQTILMYMEFDSTKYELMGKTMVNTSAANCIHTVKEICRAVASDFPFNCLHKIIVIKMIYLFIFWLNAFPVKNGVSQEFASWSIVVWTKLSCKKYCRIKFEDYAEVHDEPDPRNTISPRTHPSIYVGTTGYFNGTIKFFLDYRVYFEAPQLHALSHAWYNFQKKTLGVRKWKREVYDNVI